MEESLNASLQKIFQLPARDWKQYSPLTLAYLGDAVYDLVIRTVVVCQANCAPQKLHAQVTRLVSARAQSQILQNLEKELTPDEQAIVRRGRNSKPYTKAKNASMEEYLSATGLEALIGYLYLQGEYDRMHTLICQGIKETKIAP